MNSGNIVDKLTVDEIRTLNRIGSTKEALVKQFELPAEEINRILESDPQKGSDKVNVREEIKTLILTDKYTHRQIASMLKCAVHAVITVEKRVRRKSSLSREMIHKIKTMYKTGEYTRQELSTSLNVPLNQIMRFTRGISPTKQISQNNIAMIQKQYSSNHYSVTELAKTYNVSEEEIQLIISKEVKDVPLNDSQIAEIRRLFSTEASLSVQELAEKFNVPVSAINRHVKNLKRSTTEISQEMIDKMISLYVEGRHTHSQIASTLHVSPNTVAKYLKGIDRPSISKDETVDDSMVQPNTPPFQLFV